MLVSYFCEIVVWCVLSYNMMYPKFEFQLVLCDKMF